MGKTPSLVASKKGAADLIRRRNPELGAMRFEVLNVVRQQSGGALISIRWWDGTRTEHYLTAEEVR